MADRIGQRGSARRARVVGEVWLIHAGLVGTLPYADEEGLRLVRMLSFAHRVIRVGSCFCFHVTFAIL